MHCDGTPLTGDTGYRVDGPSRPRSGMVEWQNITFDGVPYTTLRGYNDVANIDLRQWRDRREFASLASVLTFGSLKRRWTLPRAEARLWARWHRSPGSGGTVTLGSGGNVTWAAVAPSRWKWRKCDVGQRRNVTIPHGWHRHGGQQWPCHFGQRRQRHFG